MQSVGIIGSGNMASVHADAWSEAGSAVSAILSRPGSASATALAAKHGAAVVDTIDELIATSTVVDICSPTDTHLSYIEACVEAGSPIVCEKPLARTGTDARKAADICAASSVPLLVAHVVRFFPEYAKAKQLVDDGHIGDVGIMRLNRSAYLPSEASSWFRDSDRSGGVVLDLMIHDVDYAMWVAGPVDRVFAKRASIEPGRDHVLATLTHVSGAITHVQGSWAYPPGTFRTSLDIAGSEGVIQPLPGDHIELVAQTDTEVSAVPEPPSIGVSPYVTQVLHFDDVLTHGTPSIVPPTDAVRAVEVCEAVNQSLSSGTAVSVEESQ